MKSPLVLGAFFSLVLFGCASSLKLTPIKTGYGKPSNVAVYFRVDDGKEGVGGLSAESFRIYEDNALVSQYESKQTIINPEVAASHYTLLLVDVSGSVTDSGAVATLVDAATVFTDRVEKQQKVGVYAFDGAADLHPIAPFGSPGSAKAGIASLSSYKPQDPSTNLNGAIVAALGELDKALSHAEHPMRFGTLVVFSDGLDRAHRVKEEDMKKAIAETKYDVFAIGLGPELTENHLKAIGKNGTAKAENKEEIVAAFDQIAKQIDNRTKSYYLLSYCSPSRAGVHKVKVEAIVKDDKGKTRSGHLEQEFNASGFAQGCDPKTPPGFDVTQGDALAPKKEEKKAPPKPTAVKVEGGVKVQGNATGGAQEQFNP
jgi:hypothetical protein